MRMIDVDALIERMATVYTDTDQRAHYDEIMRAIREQPTVDAVPVLRCRECREYSGVNLSILGMPCGECDKFGHVCGPDEFCSFGQERQEVEQDAAGG